MIMIAIWFIVLISLWIWNQNIKDINNKTNNH